MPGKHKVKVEKESSERWLLTYADLMNLLLIFFIILYSMSQVDSQKFSQLATSFKSSFGISLGDIGDKIIGGDGNSIIPLNPSATAGSGSDSPPLTEAQQMENLQQQVGSLISKQDLGGDVNVSLEERGVVISITAKLLFKSGSAEVEADSIPVIEHIGKAILALPGNHIRVEGHTDTDPIQTSLYPSNWELSSARATNVLRLLVEKSGANPAFISSVGYGEYRPKYPNDSEQNKALNRRVDIVIVKSMYDKSEAGKTN